MTAGLGLAISVRPRLATKRKIESVCTVTERWKIPIQPGESRVIESGRETTIPSRLRLASQKWTATMEGQRIALEAKRGRMK